MDGERADVIYAGKKQMAECRLNSCVANGPAYGDGFGLLNKDGLDAHVEDKAALFEALERSLR